MNNKDVVIYYCNWIKNPHDKIFLCFCDQNKWGFWFNSNAAFHGIAQLQVSRADHPSAITKDCYLDLSSVKAISDLEVASSTNRGKISEAFSAKICLALSEPIKMLPEVHRNLALANLG